MPTPSNRHDRAEAEAAAAFLRRKLNFQPRAAVLVGTGLGDVSRGFEVQCDIDYARIPHFPVSTVQSHQGRLLAGFWAGCPAVVLQGRFHLYEGYSPRAVTFAVRVLQGLGIETLVLTNAAGGLDPGFQPGDIMLIRDHINLTGENPLVGPADPAWGERFPVMTAAYAPERRRRVRQAAETLGLPLREGVYAGLKGPSLETGAEMRFLRMIGADAVGFSTVMETIAAVQGGIRVVGLSTITNMCLPDAGEKTSVDDIIAVARSAAPRLGALIGAVLGGLP
jgi:purine-nucleoside phosphorylase